MLNNSFFSLLFRVTLVLAAATALTSCHTHEVLFDGSARELPAAASSTGNLQPGAPLIQPGDKISVSVWGHPELSIGDATGAANATESTGKWLILDERGELRLPKIGSVKLAGLNIEEANRLLEQRFAAELQNPIVLVRVLNHHFTVLGEVNKPGVYSFENEPITLVQSIGKASGMTEQADIRQVEILRTTKRGGAEKFRVDLADFEALRQQNLFLQPDDVVYVMPSRKKAKRRNLEKTTQMVSILTGLAVVFSVISK